VFLETLDERWPESSQALLARRILSDYLRLGPVRFVANADVELLVWRAGNQVLPVVYRKRDSTSRTADVCSPWNHYVRYPLGEIDRHGRGLAALLSRSLLFLSIPILHASCIDEVVSVNNWLLATNPMADLDRPAVDRLTTVLCEKFPRRAILFRTVNPESNAELAANLVACGYNLVASRTVYLLDTASRTYRLSSDVRRDRKLLYDGDYEVVAHEGLCAADMPRLAELYRLLYIEKHSALNAEFSPLFFETVWRNRLFEFQALRREGRVDAFAAFFELGGSLTASLIGYDVRLPQDLGLYRRVTALLMEESHRRGLRMNISAGAGAFKHHRGARPCVEYDAVFDRHLPLHRRMGWRLLRVAGFLQHRKVYRGW
jgi:hypothetical protein